MGPLGRNYYIKRMTECSINNSERVTKAKRSLLTFSQKKTKSMSSVDIVLMLFDGGGFKATVRWAVVNLIGADFTQSHIEYLQVLLFKKIFGSLFHIRVKMIVPLLSEAAKIWWSQCYPTFSSSGHSDALKSRIGFYGIGILERQKILHIHHLDVLHLNLLWSY